MWLTDASIRRPVLVAMAVLAFVVLGIWAYWRLPIELFPRIDFPFVTVTTLYPGADPEEVESSVTEKIEEALATIAGLRHINSFSQEGISLVALEFELGINSDVAAAEVRDRLSAIRATLPEGVREPTVSKIDVAAFPVVTLAIAGDRPLTEIRQLTEDVIAERLERITGVATTRIIGGEVREIQVNVHADRLNAYGISLLDVVRALRSAHLNLPAGDLKAKYREYTVRLLGKFRSVDEIRNVPVRFGNRAMGYRGPQVRIGDIADVQDTIAERDEIMRLDGKEAVGLYVFRHSEANTVQVADAVRDELRKLQTILPPDIKTTIVDDQSIFIRDSLHDLTVSLLLGTLLAVLVVFIFLHDIRGTLIVSLAIPTSIAATFLPLGMVGYTLNFMVMLGLALVVGTLVDDSIVVLENIHRHLEMGELPREAAFNGRTEIGLAAVTITLVDVVVFVPMIFMGGIVGRFFRPFAVTVAVATLFSLLVSFTFTPMLASRWFKRLTRADLERPPRTSLERSFAAFDRLWRQFDVVYRTALEWALDNRTLVMFIGFGSLLTIVGFSAPPILRVRLIIAGIILGACIIAALIAKGQRTGLIAFGIICTILLATVHVPAKFSFIPRTDAGKLFVSIEMPPGTSMTQTDRLVRRVERKLMQLPEVKHVVTSVGTMGEAVRAAGSYGPEYASLLVVLVDKMKRRRSQEEIAQWIDDWARREIPEAFVGVEEQSGSAHRGAPIRLEIIGRNRSELIALANMIAERINRVNGIRDIRISWRTGRPEFQAHIDRYKAADLGFSAADVAWVLRTAIEGNTDLKFKEDTHEYDIRIRLSRDSLRTREDLMNLIIGTGFGQQPVRLRELASMIEGIGPTRLERKDREPMIAITANLRPGAHLGNVQREIQKALADIDPGANRIYFGGDIELMRENFRHLFSALALSVILVYMLQAALFNSFLLPFSIMLSLPQALVGALAALMITDKGLSIVAMIGIIMLMGVVDKNAILLVDFTNTLRARGLSLRDAVVRAGETRLRPILMTTLTLWFAVLPTALEIGRGTELRSPMAIAVLGGLTLSTLLTLLVVPVAYTIFEDVAHAIVRAWHRLIGKPSEA